MKAISGMVSGKAPGYDGLPSEFYKLFFPWHCSVVHLSK
jgi:hypothetical protein